MTSPELEDWARSGAMWLTGRADGPPILPPGRAATVVREQLAALGVEIPGVLSERAAYAGLGRNAPWSCGGAFQIVSTADGWLGLSLSRDADLSLVPALVEGSVGDDPWTSVAAWARQQTTVDADARVRLLGLPGGSIPCTPPADRAAVEIAALGPRRKRPRHESPLVVDLTGLWAGPLCAHLLGLGGARVVKVESLARPDGARFGPPAMFDLLHSGHHELALDFDTELDLLSELIADADLVLESSRPRALRQLGILAEDVVASGTSWLSITARGRSSEAVGFGDDVAASSGLVAIDDGRPIPVGDAIADPLTGVAAAVAAHAALASDEARLVDVSMLHVTSETLRDPTGRPPYSITRAGSDWWLETDDERVLIAPPQQRPGPG